MPSIVGSQGVAQAGPITQIAVSSSSPQNGDVVFAFVGTQSGTNINVNTPAGWTLLSGPIQPVLGIQSYVFQRISDGADGLGYVFTFSGTVQAVAYASQITYRGLNIAALIDGSVTTVSQTSGTSLVLPAVSPAGTASLLIALVQDYGGTGSGAISGMTQEATFSGQNLFFDQQLSAAGSTGTRTCTGLASSVSTGFLFAVAPQTTFYSLSDSYAPDVFVEDDDSTEPAWYPIWDDASLTTLFGLHPVNFRGFANVSGNGLSGNSVVCNVPAGTQNGDLMILAMLATPVPFTTPAGWTLITNDTNATTYFSRTASSEPASYTFTAIGESIFEASIVTLFAAPGFSNPAVDNFNTSLPVHASSATGPTTTATSTDLILSYFDQAGISQTLSFGAQTPPVTKIYTAGPDGGMFAACYSYQGPGTTAATVCTSTGDTGNAWRAGQISIIALPPVSIVENPLNPDPWFDEDSGDEPAWYLLPDDFGWFLASAPTSQDPSLVFNEYVDFEPDDTGEEQAWYPAQDDATAWFTITGPPAWLLVFNDYTEGDNEDFGDEPAWYPAQELEPTLALLLTPFLFNFDDYTDVFYPIDDTGEEDAWYGPSGEFPWSLIPAAGGLDPSLIVHAYTDYEPDDTGEEPAWYPPQDEPLSWLLVIPPVTFFLAVQDSYADTWETGTDDTGTEPAWYSLPDDSLPWLVMIILPAIDPALIVPQEFAWKAVDYEPEDTGDEPAWYPPGELEAASGLLPPFKPFQLSSLSVIGVVQNLTVQILSISSPSMAIVVNIAGIVQNLSIEVLQVSTTDSLL